MSYTITYTTTRTPGAEYRALARGTLPRSPVGWLASIWMLAPDGEKTTHSFNAPSCMAADLVPAIGDQIDALAAEYGNNRTQFGWSASAHGKGSKARRGGKRK